MDISNQHNDGRKSSHPLLNQDDALSCAPDKFDSLEPQPSVESFAANAAIRLQYATSSLEKVIALLREHRHFDDFRNNNSSIFANLKFIITLLVVTTFGSAYTAGAS